MAKWIKNAIGFAFVIVILGVAKQIWFDRADADVGARLRYGRRIQGGRESHKTVRNPFKHDYYRYICVFEDRWEPTYRLAQNEKCT